MKGIVMKISQIIGREIYDSRGLPTIECDLILENGTFVTSSVPSGMSRGNFEAVELRDGGKRMMGKGVLKAIQNLENVIAPILIGKEPDLVGMDLKMIDLDGTEDKSHLGANAILAASIAVCKAQALVNSMETYEFIAYLCELDSVSLPYPMFNIINGGVHANNGLTIQEFMIMPVGAQNFRHSLELAVQIFNALKHLLIKTGKSVAVGDEGGFAPDITDDKEALDLIMEAIELSGVVQEGEIVIALDVAATEFYDKKTDSYLWNSQKVAAEDLIDLYAHLAAHYPIYSIEDGLADTDRLGWKQMMARLGETLQLVGDDLFATNSIQIITGLEEGLANAVLIKPNQIGTITETLQAIKLCKNNEVNLVVSHRSGETEDTFIVDLAVGTSAGQIKAGGCCRGERIAKYNQLLRIEDELSLSLLDV